MVQETGVHGKNHRPTPSHFIIKAAGMKVINPPSIVYITVELYLTEKYKKKKTFKSDIESQNMDDQRFSKILVLWLSNVRPSSQIYLDVA